MHEPEVPAEKSESTDVKKTKRFSRFLKEHREGGLEIDLNNGLQDLVAAVVAEEGGGTLELKIKITPSDVGGAVVVTDEVKVKPPKPAVDPSLFFTDATGTLSRRDPRQPSLPGSD